VSPLPDGRTSHDEALALMRQAEEDLQTARQLVSGKRPTKAKKAQAFRLLSGVSSTCEVLKIALDPW
jgi:hypothetical protein